MTTKPAFIKPISINAFKHPKDINGKIIGIEYVTLHGLGLQERLCYKVDYSDMIDYIPVSDVESGVYRIVDTYF